MTNTPTVSYPSRSSSFPLVRPILVVALAWLSGWLGAFLLQRSEQTNRYVAALSSQGLQLPGSIWIQPVHAPPAEQPKLCSFYVGAHGFEPLSLPSWASATGAIHVSLGTRAQSRTPLLLLIGSSLPSCRIFYAIGSLAGQGGFEDAALRGVSWLLGAQVLVLPPAQGKGPSSI